MATIGTTLPGTKIIGKIDDVQFFDVKRFMARRGADKLFGQGVTFSSEREEIKNFLEDVATTNELDDLLLQAGEDANYGGRVIITIDKSASGDFVLSYANNELLQNVMKIEVTPFKAILLRRKVIGQQVFFINETWDSMKVVRSLSINDRGAIRGVNEEDKIPEELDIPTVEYHGLGFVPFIEHTNKPARNIVLTNAEGSARLQDDYGVANMAIHINNGLIQWYKEEVLAKTRVYGNFTPAELNKLKASGVNPAMQDLIISANPTPNQSKSVEVAPGTYTASPWTEAMREKINLFAIGCGYSQIFNGDDPTEAESLLSKDNDVNITKSKRRRWQVKLVDLFAKLIVYKGFASTLAEARKAFSIEIKENVVYNRLQLTDFLVQNIDAGLMSKVEAIQMARDLDDTAEAETIVSQIEEEQQRLADVQLDNDAKALQTATKMGQLGSNGDTDVKSEPGSEEVK